MTEESRVFDEFLNRRGTHSPGASGRRTCFTMERTQSTACVTGELTHHTDANKTVWFQFSKMMSEESFTDVIIATETEIFKVFNNTCMRKIFGVFFQAHKLVLSACSPFFHYLLSSSPCNTDIVIIKVNFYCIKSLLVDELVCFH